MHKENEEGGVGRVINARLANQFSEQINTMQKKGHTHRCSESEQAHFSRDVLWMNSSEFKNIWTSL